MIRRAVAAATLAAATAVFAFPVRADAHASFAGSEPADGAFVEAAPRRVVLRFSEPVLAGASTAWLVTAEGARTPLALTAGESGDQLVATLDRDATGVTGVVQVAYQAVGVDDLHAVKGAVTIGIGEPAVLFGPPSRPAPPALAEIVGRFIAVAGVSLVVGVATVRWVLVPGRVGGLLGAALRRQRRSTSHVLRAGCGLVVVGEILEVARAFGALGDHSPTLGRLRDALGSAPGRTALASIVLALAVARGAARARRRVANLERMVLATALAALTAGSVHSWPVPSAVARLVATLHVLGIGAWVGGLVTLAAVLGGRAVRANLPGALRAYSPYALSAGAVTVVTGAMMSVHHVPTVDLATTSAYGQTMTAKLVAAGAVVVAGLHQRRRWARESGAIRRAPAVAVAGGVAALWGAAALSATAPASATPAAVPPAVPPRAASVEQAELRVTTVLSRAAVGESTVVVKPRATSSTGGGIGELEVRVSGSALDAPVTTSPEPRNGAFEVPVTIARPGAVVVSTRLVRATRGEDTFTSTLYVVQPARAPRLLLPSIPTAVLGRSATVVAAAVIVAVWYRPRRREVVPAASFAQPQHH